MANNGRLWRVYLAEDNPGDVYLVKEALRLAGLNYELTLFEDGHQALKRFDLIGSEPAAVYPDVFLLDLNLPRSDGGEVLRSLRENTRWSRLLVVILTSSESPTDRALADTYDATYFRKPNELDPFLKIGAYIRDLIHQPVDGN